MSITLTPESLEVIESFKAEVQATLPFGFTLTEVVPQIYYNSFYFGMYIDYPPERKNILPDVGESIREILDTYKDDIHGTAEIYRWLSGQGQTTEVVDIDTLTKGFQVHYTKTKGTLKVSFANLEELIIKHSSPEDGNWFFPKSTTRWNNVFNRSIAIGLEKDGLCRIYVIGANKGILGCFSSGLPNGVSPKDIIEGLDPQVAEWNVPKI